jgi:hypothetical protein
LGEKRSTATKSTTISVIVGSETTNLDQQLC